ncbi:hypothetical protein [Paenibacillus mendelii]|uniref:Uncharacterized protein n=1 Tax=Paenibacillus mendelii TaxID=206163 RepID=A0ABV6J2G4_9BACL|nr:hypothetical protein [Paenibacillus mendelii]MCQ6563290.1 hypothetical protein [Paenibacillus mendelii]
MTDPGTGLTIKPPSGIPAIILFSFLAGMKSIVLIRLIQNGNDQQTIIYIYIGMIFIYLILLAIEICKLFIKPSVLVFHPESLSIRGRSIEANEIERIMVMGYFKPILGIKPFGKKMVPFKLCFRFVGAAHTGIDELTRWAKQNNIAVINKRFMRWW